MQLDPAEKRSVWWKGALKGAARGLAIGVVSGLVAAAGLYGLWLLFPGSLALIGNFVAPSGFFNPIPLIAFNGIISSAIGLFTGGSAAVTAYHQNKHNARDEAKLIELDGRTRALEQEVARSPHVQKILEAGPHAASGYRDAELARSAETPAAPTLH